MEYKQINEKEKYFQCRTCKKKLTTWPPNTSNAIKHLGTHIVVFNKEYKQLEKEWDTNNAARKKPKNEDKDKNQMTLTNFQKTVAKYSDCKRF